jgi:hypothetical protein
MAKYHGMIGYADTVLTGPGKWEEKIVEKEHFGDLLKNYVRRESSGGVNENITISNNISMVANAYAKEHFHQMRYATFMGTKWEITSVDASQYPRLILTVGGLYTDG